MPDIRKLIKKTSSEDDNAKSTKTEDTSEKTAEVIDTTKTVESVESNVVLDLDNDDDIAIGDDDDYDDNSKIENTDSADEINSNEVNSGSGQSKISRSVKSNKKTPVIKKKTITTKKKPTSVVKISDLTKSSAMDDLLIDFLENKGVDGLKSVLRKHIIDQFNENVIAITKDNEKINLLFEKNLRNNSEVVKSVHGIYDRYSKLQNTDFNNGILPIAEVEKIKSENLTKIEKSVSIVLNQYRNMLESELVRINELDVFGNFEPLEEDGFQTKPSTREPDIDIEKNRIKMDADSEREKELISEMEKYLGETPIIDTDITVPEETEDKTSETIVLTDLNESDEIDSHDETIVEETEPKEETKEMVDFEKLLNDDVIVPSKADTEESKKTTVENDLNEILSNFVSSDEETKKEEPVVSDEQDDSTKENTSSSDIDLSFLDNLDISVDVMPEVKKEENVTEKTANPGEFDADEFLRDLARFAPKDQKSADDEEPVRIQV